MKIQQIIQEAHEVAPSSQTWGEFKDFVAEKVCQEIETSLLSGEALSEAIQRDTAKWQPCGAEFILDIAQVSARAQLREVLKILRGGQ